MKRRYFPLLAILLASFWLVACAQDSGSGGTKQQQATTVSTQTWTPPPTSSAPTGNELCSSISGCPTKCMVLYPTISEAQVRKTLCEGSSWVSEAVCKSIVQYVQQLSGLDNDACLARRAADVMDDLWGSSAPCSGNVQCANWCHHNYPFAGLSVIERQCAANGNLMSGDCLKQEARDLIQQAGHDACLSSPYNEIFGYH